jgi:sugar lactone lactonase YvrE
MAQGQHTSLPLRWLEGPTWVGPEPPIGDGGGSSGSTVLVSDVISNRIWRWTAAAGEGAAEREQGVAAAADVFLEPSGKSQPDRGEHRSISRPPKVLISLKCAFSYSSNVHCIEGAGGVN